MALDKPTIFEVIEYLAVDNLKNMNLDYKAVKVQVGSKSKSKSK